MRTTTTRPAWLTAPVLTVSVLSVAAGIAQFSVTAVIGDVAAAFGEVGPGESMAAQIGLPTTTVGIALSIVRLASLASLPIASLADRFGRRSVLLVLAAIGLALTSMAALSPGFWWYVALVSLARPAMSTVNALSGVVAAEESRSRDRSAAIALVTAAYGVGSGIVAIARGVLPGEPSFRVVTAFAVVPLLLLPLLARRIREPKIVVERVHPGERRTRWRAFPGAVPAQHRRNVTVLATLTGAAAMTTGPGFTYLFLYGERLLGASPLMLSALVVAAAPAGLAGILLGRLGADRLGRRITSATAMGTTGIAVAFAYSGSTAALAGGYLAAIATSSAFAAPTGALAAELVPTRIRATVAGWMTVAGIVGSVTGLVAVGALSDVFGTFSTPTAVIGTTVLVAAAGFAVLPETRGWELDTHTAADEAGQRPSDAGDA